MPSVDLSLSDAHMGSSVSVENTNTSGSEFLSVGATPTGAITRAIIIPDFSPVSGMIITSATLKMTPILDNSDNARTMYAHRILQSVNIAQCTWHIYSTGNNWGANGCSNSTSDYDGAVVIGSASQAASPTLNSAHSFTMSLDPDEMQKFNDGTYTNNGIVLFKDTQVYDLISHASNENTTAEYRPVITVEYATNTKRFFSFLQNRRNKRSLVYG
jgi:hypothetical protein